MKVHGHVNQLDKSTTAQDIQNINLALNIDKFTYIVQRNADLCMEHSDKY